MTTSIVPNVSKIREEHESTMQSQKHIEAKNSSYIHQIVQIQTPYCSWLNKLWKHTQMAAV